MLESPEQARTEFDAQIRMAKTSGFRARPVKGPWQRGLEFGDIEVYALDGPRILHFQYFQSYPATIRYRRGAARRATAAAARFLRTP